MIKTSRAIIAATIMPGSTRRRLDFCVAETEDGVAVGEDEPDMDGDKLDMPEIEGPPDDMPDVDSVGVGTPLVPGGEEAKELPALDKLDPVSGGVIVENGLVEGDIIGGVAMEEVGAGEVDPPKVQTPFVPRGICKRRVNNNKTFRKRPKFK